MAIKSLQNSNNSNNSLEYKLKSLDIAAKALFAKKYTPWVKNPEWPELSVPATTTQQIQMLVSIPTGGHLIAFNCAGAYTVDWGDGTTENIATGVQSNHIYKYANISSSATSMGYKVVTVTITPQAGQNLTTFNTNIRCATTWKNLAGSNVSLTVAIDTRILDMVVSMPYGTSLTIGSNSPTVFHNSLERVRITSSAITTTANLFYNCYGLQAYEIASSANITDVSNTFNNCYSLRYATWFQTKYATNATYMFNGCSSLLSTADFNFSAVTNFAQTFYNCKQLLFVPFNNLPKATNLSSMFYGCGSLMSVPNFYMPLVTTVQSMFQLCVSLVYIPAWQMPKVTNMNSFLYSCYSLEVVPNFYAPIVTNLSLAFSTCYALHTLNFVPPNTVTSYSQCFQNTAALRTIPTLDCTSATSLAYMFQACSSLETVSLINTNKVADFTNTFGACTALETIGTITISVNTALSGTFQGCSKLEKITWGILETAPYVAPANNYNWTPRGIALHPNGVDMYIMQASAYIQHMKWNIGTGRFVLGEQKTNTSGNQFWGVVTPDGNYLFASNNATNLYAMPITAASGFLGTSTGYTIGSSSRLTLSPDGTKLYAASASGGILYYFTRASAGILTSGTLNNGLSMPDCDVSKDNLFLYVVTGGSNTILTYAINQTTGALTLISTTSGLNNGTCVTVSPDNLHVYVSNYNANNILVYTRDATYGVLTLSQTFTMPLTPNSGSPYKIVFSADGRFAYVNNYNASSFTAMSRDTTTGNLTSIGVYGTRVNPTGIAISADSLYLHISCGTGGNNDGMVSIPLDTTTGLPLKPPAPVITYSNAFSNCANLKDFPPIDFSSITYGGTPLDSSLYSLEKMNAKGALTPINVNSLKLSSEGLNTYLLGLQRPYNAPNTLACTNNPGYNGRSKTGSTWTTTSLSITTSSTSDISIGDIIWGTFNHAVNANWTFNSGTNTITHTGNTRINGTQISFNNITNAQGVALYFPYYIVNATGTSFQISHTEGGTPIGFENGTSTSAYFEIKVTGITNLTTFTVDNYPMIAGTNTTLNVASARITYGFMNGWNVS